MVLFPEALTTRGKFVDYDYRIKQLGNGIITDRDG
jgi:hypothetical protein